MMIEAIFVFTAAMCIVASFKMIGHMLGNTVNLPKVIPYTGITPTFHIIMYPSTMFQVWFWADYFGVFVQ